MMVYILEISKIPVVSCQTCDKRIINVKKYSKYKKPKPV